MFQFRPCASTWKASAFLLLYGALACRPRTRDNDYLIRYFQTPTGFGAGEFGAAPRRLFVDLFFGGVPVGKLHAAERHALLKRRDAGVFREDGVADPRGLPDQKAPTARTSICTRRPSSCATAS